MKTKQVSLMTVIVFVLAVSTLAFVGCSGGGSSGASGVTGTNDTDTNDTTTGGATEDDLQSIATLPRLDLDSLDAVASATSSGLKIAGLSRSARVEAAEAEQRFSRAGCECRAQWDEFKFLAQEFVMHDCILRAMETYSDFEVGKDGYATYQITIPAGVDDEGGGECPDDVPECEEEVRSEDEGEVVLVRVGTNIDGDDKFHMQMCDLDPETDEYRHSIDLEWSVSSGNFVGSITDSYKFEDRDGTIRDDRMSVNINLPDSDISEWAEAAEGSATGTFFGSYGAGTIALTIINAATGIQDVVDGAFRSGDEDTEWGTWSGFNYCKFDKDGGCNAWRGSGTYPAEYVGDAFRDDFSRQELLDCGFELGDRFCWVDSDIDEGQETTLCDWVEAADENGMCSFTDEGIVECFTLDVASDGNVNYFELDTDNATYFDAVSDHVDRLPDEVTIPTIEHKNSWDCSADTIVEIDLSTDLKPGGLEAIEACFDDFDYEKDSFDSCNELEKEQDFVDEFIEGDCGEECADWEFQDGPAFGMDCGTDDDCFELTAALDSSTVSAICFEPDEFEDDETNGVFDDEFDKNVGSEGRGFCTIPCTKDADCEELGALSGIPDLVCEVIGESGVCI